MPLPSKRLHSKNRASQSRRDCRERWDRKSERPTDEEGGHEKGESSPEQEKKKKKNCRWQNRIFFCYFLSVLCVVCVCVCVCFCDGVDCKSRDRLRQKVKDGGRTEGHLPMI